MTSLIQVNVKQVSAHPKPLPLPTYQSPHAAGMDLMADIEMPVTLKPGERKLIPTGLSIELPEGFEAQVRPRSGLALKKGISIANAPGTIDADYRGEICVILINLGAEPVNIERGDRIAQMVVAPVTRVEWAATMELSETRRATGGFGSTGT